MKLFVTAVLAAVVFAIDLTAVSQTESTLAKHDAAHTTMHHKKAAEHGAKHKHKKDKKDKLLSQKKRDEADISDAEDDADVDFSDDEAVDFSDDEAVDMQPPAQMPPAAAPAAEAPAAEAPASLVQKSKETAVEEDAAEDEVENDVSLAEVSNVNITVEQFDEAQQEAEDWCATHDCPEQVNEALSGDLPAQ